MRHPLTFSNLSRFTLSTVALVTLPLLLSSCVPLLVAGAGVGTVTTAAKEKGISGSMSDTQISTSIKTKIYQKDQDLHSRVGVSVQSGEVLLTGSLPTQELIDEVQQIVWSVPGVKKVMNELSVKDDDSLNLKQGTLDSWITTQVKSAMVFTTDIKSINYNIKTVSGIVYVMGVAQNQAELKKVLDTARQVRGVKKVVSYVQMKEPTAEGENADSSFDPSAERVTVVKEETEGDTVKETSKKGGKSATVKKEEPASEEEAVAEE